jgi:putative alpha-1,2-mannosidase
MNTFNRNGNRWTVNELLSLQREYELLEWTIQQIAVKHQRTEAAILFKLESEGFITSWNNARGFDMNSYKGTFEDDNVSENYDSNEEYEDCDNESEYSQDDDVTSDVEKLSERIWSLETQVTDIKEVVQQYFNSMISSNNKKRKPLRKQNAKK